MDLVSYPARWSFSFILGPLHCIDHHFQHPDNKEIWSSYVLRLRTKPIAHCLNLNLSYAMGNTCQTKAALTFLFWDSKNALSKENLTLMLSDFSKSTAEGSAEPRFLEDMWGFKLVINHIPPTYLLTSTGAFTFCMNCVLLLAHHYAIFLCCMDVKI